ncbi:hypothetical protein CGRA01v4_10651 [Colletotrichum graminicola]|uniref:Uncharacterized protein n=1 Tax=Colletotrichum graminicola (strain M1.001 / M2 / FGSC 10212) TaxID=645133 RepID=E3QKF2_COLGM|nr:uncharacterized protein GLRG_06484 [Colletotrichum graminicola M1.001]EFQ31340.1 hypothetical protein GLRG_06484 [Colletotrichum graminicola M1.001]WDK19364.1 hypothetical protein CGRA01v4_10651 [Colletotrichum graminicola]
MCAVACQKYSGAGVIATFTVTAFITLCLATFCLVRGRTNEARQSFNPVDRPSLPPSARYLVNTFSELQLVTGLAVLVGGIKDVADGSISTYHFLIVTDLAWFCTLAHLLSLAVTRSMRDSVKRTHPRRYHHENTELAARLARALRICFMAATFLLLIYAFWVAGYEEIYHPGQYRCPMNYVVQMFLSWRTGRLFWMDHIRGYLINNKGGQPVNVLSPEAVFKRWTENKLWKGLKMCLLAVWYFLASEVETLLRLTVYFGQLVPISLLIIPFMGLFESYARHSKALREQPDAKVLDSCTSEGP